MNWMKDIYNSPKKINKGIIVFKGRSMGMSTYPVVWKYKSRDIITLEQFIRRIDMKGIKRGKEYMACDSRNVVQPAIKQNMPMLYWFYLKVETKWELKDIRKYADSLPPGFSGMNWHKRLKSILKIIRD